MDEMAILRLAVRRIVDKGFGGCGQSLVVE